MTMKMIMTNIKTLAALLMAGAALTACSSDDEILSEQPANPTEPKTYTMTIPASKGDDATTRGLYFTDDTQKNLQVNWNGTEKVRVVQDGKVIGTLSAAMSNGENDNKTTLTGTVTGFVSNHAIGFYLLADENGKMDYTGQNGAMLDENGTGNIEENYDYASYELTGSECMQAFKADGSNIVPKDDGVYIPFTSQQAIVKFTIKKPTNNLGTEWGDLYASKFIVTDKNTGKLVQSIDAKSGTKTYGHVTLTPSGLSTSNVYNVAMNLEGNTSDIRLFAEAKDEYGNPELYMFEKENVTFTKGKYYRVTVKMSRITKFPLSEITHEDTQFKGWYIGSGDNESAYQNGGSSLNAVIAYVGKVPGYFDNFLAISMHDSKKDGTEGREVNASTWAVYANQNSVGKYAANHPIKIGSTTYNTNSFDNYNGGNYQTFDWVDNSTTTASNTYSGATLKGWRMPTITDWRYIFYGLCGTPSPTDPAGVGHQIYLSGNPLTILNADPGYDLDLSSGGPSYCTSSGIKVGSDENVWYIYFATSNAPYFEYYNNYGASCHLRPVFAY